MRTMTGNWNLLKEKFDPDSNGKRRFGEDFRSLADIRHRLSHPIRLRREPLDDTDFLEIEKWMNLVGEGS